MLSDQNAVVVGIGELGSVFAKGLLKLGRPVFPVTRKLSVLDVLEAAQPVDLILVSVGESDLVPTLRSIPERFRDRVALVQNELVPRHWQEANIERPSGVVVWFEKKAGRSVHVVLPSRSYGPKSKLLSELLTTLSIPVYELNSRELEFQLALKNLYILVHNLAGLRYAGSVAALWREHESFALEIAEEVLVHQEALIGCKLDRFRLLEQLRDAVSADPDHACAGRTAPERLERVLRQAAELNIELPAVEKLRKQA